MADVFGTDELRRRVLEAWQASPARFRADANVEDDLALTGYRDRVIVELAQNAADAATRAGIAGSVTFALNDDVLTVTNTGAPLDAAGVESISVARASAKADQVGTVGRFGVGFAAVLTVTDEPSIASTTGTVRWSRADAYAAVTDVPALAAELANRGDRVPVLRLPFASDGATTTGTTVTLPLRDEAAADAVRTQLADLDATLLLALPSLAEVVIRIDDAERSLSAERDGQALTLHDADARSHWRVFGADGRLPAELLADRPVEEQRLDTWTVTWAIPTDDSGAVARLPDTVKRVVRAPTEVDDPLTVPAVLVASYPLDSARRRVTTGALADVITGHAADVLADALTRLPSDPSLLRLVPTGFPNGEVDGAIHAAVLDRLADPRWLPTTRTDARQRPREAVLVPDGLVDVLSDVVPAVLPPGWSSPELTALGVRRPQLAELVEELGSIRQEPAWWRRLYAALDAAIPAGPERDALGALPVPLADGSMARGPRGLALPDPETPAADLGVLGVRLVHPDAAHDLLRSFGAVDGSPRDLLEQPAVQAAVEASYDEEDPRPIADAVLSLLAATAVGVEELPWLAELALTDADGEWRIAAELVVADGVMAALIAEDSAFGVVAGEWAARHGRAAVIAAGVLDGPAVLRESEAVAATHDLDDEASWWATLPMDSTVEEFLAIRDLEQVRDDALPVLLTELAQPPLRAAVTEPALLRRPDGGRSTAQSYTAWWLSSRPIIEGRSPSGLRLSDGDPLLDALYDVAPAAFDQEFLQALGVLGSLADADPDDVVRRLADSSRAVGRQQLRRLNAWIADQSVTPPDQLRVVRAGEVVVMDAADVVVVDAPDLLGLLGDCGAAPVSLSRATALADALDVPLASTVASFAVTSTGRVEGDAVVHDSLTVSDLDGVDREVSWRLVDGELHVNQTDLAFGLGRGRAWRDGDWPSRHRRTEASNDPSRGMMRTEEDDLDEELEP